MKCLIVGAGLTGSVISRELTDRGHNCVVIDKRNHVGGNCYTENIKGINVHKYGPHIFHTNDKEIYEYLTRYTTLNNFRCQPKLFNDGKLYSLPVNLMSMYQLYGTYSPEDAKKIIDEKTKKYRDVIKDPQNAEEYALCSVGEDIYNIFYKDYLEKQWNRKATDIPAFIMKRQVIRYNYNDSYYNDFYQGIPNYTLLFNNLLKGIKVELNIDFNAHKDYFLSTFDKIYYTGPIDSFYDYSLGELEYRSLRFEQEIINIPDYQGVFMVSYPEKKYKYTRIIEHSHFEMDFKDYTIITKEYSVDWNKKLEPFYPIGNDKNNKLYTQYKNINKYEDVIFCGRLGSYKYINMDESIKLALDLLKNK